MPQFQPPDFLTKQKTKEEALLGPISESIKTLPSQWDNYKLMRMKEKEAIAKFGTGQPAPSSEEMPEEKQRRLWSDAFGQLNPQIKNPASIDGILAQRVSSGAMTLEQAIEAKKSLVPSTTIVSPTGDFVSKVGGKATVLPQPSKGVSTPAQLSTALDLYETARDGLMSGLSGSETGPVMGRIPSFTSGQQIAEGSVAAMAPVLKQLFRVSGEGVFTDRDQQLLLDMVPTRKDTPDARNVKMQNIDNIVKAKLGMGKPAPTTGAGPNQDNDPLGIR